MDVATAAATGMLLGLTSAGQCFWSCAAVMAPYLDAVRVPDASAPDVPRDRWASIPDTLLLLLLYNAGRFIAYLTVAALLVALASAVTANQLPPAIGGGARLAMAALLAVSLIRPATHRRCWHNTTRGGGAFAIGILQGISPCPPFFAAIGIGLTSNSALATIVLFAALFVATALYTLPLALLDPLRNQRWLHWLMRALGVIVCAYLILTGMRLAIA